MQTIQLHSFKLCSVTCLCVCVYKNMGMKIGIERDFIILVPILIPKNKKVNPPDPWKNCKSWQGNNYIYTQWAAPPVLQHWAVIHSMSSLVHTMIFHTMLSNERRGLDCDCDCSVYYIAVEGFSSRSDAGRDHATPHAAIANAPSHLTLQTVSTFHFLWKAQTLCSKKERKKKDSPQIVHVKLYCCIALNK